MQQTAEFDLLVTVETVPVPGDYVGFVLFGEMDAYLQRLGMDEVVGVYEHVKLRIRDVQSYVAGI